MGREGDPAASKGVDVKHAAPLHGTWLVVLVVSACFAVSTIASAEPWIDADGEWDSVALADHDVASEPGVITDVVALDEEATITPIVATLAHQPTRDGQPSVDAGPEVVDQSTGDEVFDEESVWERAANHGSYVSAVARESRGHGSGCDVSAVARSEIGKKDRDDEAGTVVPVGSCSDPAVSAPTSPDKPDKSDKSDKPDKPDKPDKSDKSQGDEASDD